MYIYNDDTMPGVSSPTTQTPTLTGEGLVKCIVQSECKLCMVPMAT